MCIRDSHQVAACRGERLVLLTLDDESGVGDHLQVSRSRLPFAGQVVAQEDGVGQVQAERLQAAQVDLTAARNAHLGVWKHEAEQGKDAQAALRSELPLPAERRALERDEEVDRHRVGIAPAEGEGEVHHIGVGLAHAEDGTRARREPRVLRHPHRVDAIGIGVRRADVAVIGFARVEIVVVRVHAGGKQALRSLGGQEAERGAHLDIGVTRLDGAHRFGDALHVAIGWPPPTRHEACLLYTSRCV